MYQIVRVHVTYLRPLTVTSSGTAALPADIWQTAQRTESLLKGYLCFPGYNENLASFKGLRNRLLEDNSVVQSRQQKSVACSSVG